MDAVPMCAIEDFTTEEDWQRLEALSGLSTEARSFIRDATDAYILRQTQNQHSPAILREAIVRLIGHTKRLNSEMTVLTSFAVFPEFVRTDVTSAPKDAALNAGSQLDSLSTQLIAFQARLETMERRLLRGKPGPKSEPLIRLLNELNMILLYFTGQKLTRAKRDKKTGIGLCDFAIEVCRLISPEKRINPSTVMNVIKDQLDALDDMSMLIMDILVMRSTKGQEVLRRRPNKWRYYDLNCGGIMPLVALTDVPIDQAAAEISRIGKMDEQELEAQKRLLSQPQTDIVHSSRACEPTRIKASRGKPKR